MKGTSSRRLCLVALACGITGCFSGESILPSEGAQVESLQAAPAAAIPAPADYDGDGSADIAVKSASGIWYIDVAANGFGSRWDYAYWGYGDSTAVPVPADYDGDGKADIAVKDATGMWGIDFAWNGFGAWDAQYYGYGNSASIPVPADYDGDHKADLAIKTSTGDWYIDYAANGFGAWDVHLTGYGDSTFVPVPADYDGDLHADIAVKGSNGCWYIDYASGGFGAWNWSGCGYGNATAVPTPADYDGDGKADIAIKDSSGTWYIDYAAGGFGSWNASYCCRGSGTSVPADYDHDHHADLAVADTSTGYYYIDDSSNGFSTWDVTVNNPGRVLTDATNPYIYSTKIYGPGDIALGGASSPSTIPTTPNLAIGVRYTVDVAVQPGTDPYEGQTCDSTHPCPTNYACEGPTGSTTCHANDGVEINPNLHVPTSLNVVNPSGSTWGDIAKVSCCPGGVCSEANCNLLLPLNSCTGPTGTCSSNGDCCSGACVSGKCTAAPALCNGATGYCDIHRRYSFTCTQPGNYPLGFELRNLPAYYGATQVINPDYGTRVFCTANGHTGVYGTVTTRVQSASHVYVPGSAIAGATIRSGTLSTTSAADGSWSLPTVTGGPVTVTVSASGYSDTVAVNVTVPTASGVEIDTPLEESFSTLSLAGVTYTTYVDYGHNRQLLHVLKVNPSAVKVSHAQSTITGYATNTCTSAYVPNLVTTQQPGFDYLQHIATTIQNNPPHNFLGLINAVWWDQCNGNSVGYTYDSGVVPSGEVWCDGGAQPPFQNTKGSCTYCVGGSNAGAPCSSNTDCTGGGTCSASSTLYYAEGGGTIWAQDTQPMLSIVGTGANQLFSVLQSDDNFWQSPSTQWNVAGSPAYPIWDVSPRDGVSDVSYALQIGNPPLVWGGKVIAGGTGWCSSVLCAYYDFAYARTAIGVGTGARPPLYLVVADGEGVMGGNGPTGNQLAHFFRDTLGVTAAMGLDSGLSTQMILEGASGPRRLNTITGEDARIQLDGFASTLYDTLWGSVANYLMVTD